MMSIGSNHLLSRIFSSLVRFIIVFYVAKGSGKILEINSSRIGCHRVLECQHAEEVAIDNILRKWSRKYNINDIYVLIWKQNCMGEMRPIFACNWCSKIIKKSPIINSHVITLSDEYIDGCFKTIDVESKRVMTQLALNEALMNKALRKNKYKNYQH